MVKSGRVKGVAVWNLSRFSRSVKDAPVALERVEAAGGRVYSATEEYGDDSAGRFTRNVLLTVAQMERERAAEGFRAAKASASERGIHMAGRVPLGYRRGADRRLEIDPTPHRSRRASSSGRQRGCPSRRSPGGARAGCGLHRHRRPVHARQPDVLRRGQVGRAREGERAPGPRDVEPVPASPEPRRQVAADGPSGGTLLARQTRALRQLRVRAQALDGRQRPPPFYYCRHRHCQERGYAGAADLDAFVLNRIDELLTGLDYDGVRVGEATDEEAWQAATFQTLPGDGREVEDAEAALEEARADLDAWLANTTLPRHGGVRRRSG